MQSVLVAVAASNGGHHPKVTRSMFSHPAMGGRHWRRPLQNITVQAENIHASPLRLLRLGEKNIPKQLLFSKGRRPLSTSEFLSQPASLEEAECFITPV